MEWNGPTGSKAAWQKEKPDKPNPQHRQLTFTPTQRVKSNFSLAFPLLKKEKYSNMLVSQPLYYN